jgi:hypothetical protein
MGFCEHSNEWAFGFHIRQEISCLGEWLLASPKGFCSKELTSQFTRPFCQSVSLGVEPHRGSWPGIYYCLTVTVFFLWGALSDNGMGLSFVYAAGPCQRSLSQVRVPSDSRPYFTVSDLRHPISSPPMTHRVTVEVFDPTSTRVLTLKTFLYEGANGLKPLVTEYVTTFCM